MKTTATIFYIAAFILLALFINTGKWYALILCGVFLITGLSCWLTSINESKKRNEINQSIYKNRKDED